MNAIEIKGLEKQYKGFSLGPIDFELPTGCVTGLVGENGAGKSTVIKLIMGIVNKNAGEITVLGQNNTKDFEIIKEDIGLVLDEVGIPQEFKAKEINNVFKGIYKNWDEQEFFGYMNKFDVSKYKAFKDLSKGMKMKVAIAVAMSHKPKLLIFDEATAGLDPYARDEVIEMLNDFTRDENHSVLISSHIVSDLEKICDYICFLHNGKIIIHEEKDVLKASYGIINCTKEEAEALDKSIVVGMRENEFSTVVAVRKSPAVTKEIKDISIEDLFVYMIKEGRQ